ncbi:MAG: translation elongation factor Ts [Myxococcota bacterium]|nr:translation elongation factor Ts [Myxococcota bacterium]
MYKPSMSDIKDLRARTGAGIKDCKTALKESEGDLSNAIDWLRKKGIAKAAKKASRVAAEGLIYAEITGSKGVLLEVNCETDFVAKTADFQGFVKEAANVVLDQTPNSMEDLLEQSTWAEGRSAAEAQQQIVLRTGENIKVRRFSLFEASEGSHLYSYIHTGARLGVLLEVQAPAANELEDFMEDVAMHIVASRPEYVTAKEIPSEITEKEFSIQMDRANEDEKLKNKPPKILEGIIRGRIGKWKKEISLLDQEWYDGKKITV